MELCPQLLESFRWKTVPFGGDSDRCHRIQSKSHSVSWRSYRWSSSSLRLEFLNRRRSSVSCGRDAHNHGAAGRIPWYDSSATTSSSRTYQSTKFHGNVHRQGLMPIGKSVIAANTSSTVSVPRCICALISSLESQDASSRSPRVDHVTLVENFYDENEFLFEDETWNIVGKDGEKDDTRPLQQWFKKFRLSIAAGRVQPTSQVLVGGGSAAFVHQLCLASAPASLVFAHFSLLVLGEVKEMNDDAVCWHGDIADLPESYGPFETVFLNSVIAIAYTPVHLLQAVAGLCKPGGRIVICHSQGTENLSACRDKNPQIVLHSLPDAAALEAMTSELPLKLIGFQDDPDFYLATLEVNEILRSIDPELNSGQVQIVASKQHFVG